MGFKEVKRKAIECIKNDHVRHVARGVEKNLFASGELTSAEVINIIGSCQGDCYETDKHHFLDIEVHILRPRGKYDGFYIKFFFVEPDILFISVHLSDVRG